MAAVITLPQLPPRPAQVALVSGLPVEYTRQLAKKLAAYGCEVVQFLDLKRGPRGTIRGDAVLFLYEFSGHGDDIVFEKAATAARMPFLRISRRSSMWPDQLEPLHQAMAQARAIAPSDLETVCRLVTEERAKGTSWDAMCQLVQPYYRNHINGWSTVRQTLQRLQRLGETPSWFAWFPNDTPPALKVARKPPAAPASDATLPALPSAPTIPPPPPSQPAVAPAVPPSDDGLLRELYVQENEELRAKVAKLEAELAAKATPPGQDPRMLLLQIVHVLAQLTETLSR